MYIIIKFTNLVNSFYYRRNIISIIANQSMVWHNCGFLHRDSMFIHIFAEQLRKLFKRLCVLYPRLSLPVVRGIDFYITITADLRFANSRFL